MEVPKYVQQGKASQCTVEQNFPEVSAVERKLKSQQSADARLIMSAACVIYVQEYAVQDISKKHGKAQTLKWRLLCFPNIPRNLSPPPRQ